MHFLFPFIIVDLEYEGEMIMQKKTAEYMKQYHMAKKGEKIVLGLSGGMDSVCLFYLLKDLGYSLEAVHVHHKIRGEEADRDERFVRELCLQYNVPFHGYQYDVPKISREEHLSEEEAGRMVRRQSFFEVQRATGAKWIALAHHANDRAETFLFHLCRGSGAKGLGSIKPVQGSIIRPLLWAKREEIESYVKEQGYAYVEDESNISVEYTRNKIRHEILPGLSGINTKSVEHICGAADKLSKISDYIDREAEKLMQQSARMYPDEIHISKSALYEGDSFLHIPVLQKCVEYLSKSLVNMTEEHLKSLAGLFKMQTGKEITLPYGMTAMRTYEGIRMFFREEKKIPEPVEITGEGDYEFGGLTFRVSIESWSKRQNFPIKTYTKCFDYDKIKDKVFLRTRASGDFLEINKDHGRKSLQDYLVNEKISKDKRDHVLLLSSGSHILWVVGKRISEYYKITKETKNVLKVQVSGGKIDE